MYYFVDIVEMDEDTLESTMDEAVEFVLNFEHTSMKRRELRTPQACYHRDSIKVSKARFLRSTKWTSKEIRREKSPAQERWNKDPPVDDGLHTHAKKEKENLLMLCRSSSEVTHTS